MRSPEHVGGRVPAGAVTEGGLGGDVGDAWRCTSSPSVGKACGPAAKIDVTVDGCNAASVRAVVAPLPRGLDMAIGRDVIEKSVRSISFATMPPTFRCRAKRQHVRPAKKKLGSI